jgi:hypothetical protein
MVWMLIAIVVVIAAAAGWWAWRRRERTAQLRQRFGPEYERVVRESGAVTQGEARLEARAKRVAELHIRPLAPEARTRYADTWNRVQNRFVDDPQGAVTEADRLVGEVMHERGYPLGDFEQRVEDISVDHPDVVMNYRATRDIAARNAAGKTTTEDLRQAMVHYRALFRDLLATPEPERKRDTADREIARERR